MKESDDAWPDVIVTIPGWRLIRSKDAKPATQWIIQRWSGVWRSERFFQDGNVLRRYCRNVPHMNPNAAITAFYAHESVQEAVRALPSHCPQREARIGSRASAAGKD